MSFGTIHVPLRTNEGLSLVVRPCRLCKEPIFHAYNHLGRVIALDAVPTDDGTHILVSARPPRVTPYNDNLADHRRFRHHADHDRPLSKALAASRNAA